MNPNGRRRRGPKRPCSYCGGDHFDRSCRNNKS